MKCFYFFILIATGVVVLPACHKSNSGGSNTSGNSQWTINGNTYTGLATTYNDTSSTLGVLTSADAAGNYIAMVFYSHPSAGGTYTVTNGSLPNSTSCLITIGVYSGGSSLYTSTGKTGDKVTLSISGGKLTAAFTGVTMAYNSTTTTATGMVKQQ